MDRWCDSAVPYECGEVYVWWHKGRVCIGIQVSEVVVARSGEQMSAGVLTRRDR